MAREAAPPKGIQKIHRKNIDSDSTFYRVRLERKKEKFSVDKLFDTLELAIAFLAECKTLEGRKRVLEGVDNVTQTMQIDQITAKAAVKSDPNIKEQLRNAHLGNYIADLIGGKFITVDDAIASYSRIHIWPFIGKNRNGQFVDENGSPVKKLKNPPPNVRENIRESQKKRDRQLEVIANIELPYLAPEKRQGKVAAVGSFHKLAITESGEKKKRFGDWPLMHVTKQTGRDYIDARTGTYTTRDGTVKTRSVSTVQRDIVMMSGVFAHVEFADDLRNAWQELMHGENPFAGVSDKRLLAAKVKDNKLAEKADKRWRQLSKEEETTLTNALTAYAERTKHKTETCPEPLEIFKLSLATGLRLSEAVLLEWSFIDLPKNSIWLSKQATKTKKQRRVYLNADARAIINNLPRNGERLFKMSVSGLNTAMFKIYKETKLEDLRWHDLRRTQTTRFINDNPHLTPTQVAQETGATSIKHIQLIMERRDEDAAFQTGHLTEKQKQASLGHSSDQTTLYMQEPAPNTNTRSVTRATTKKDNTK